MKDIRFNSSSFQVITEFSWHYGQIQDLLFLDEQIFISSSEVIRKGSYGKTLLAWDFRTTSAMHNQLYPVISRNLKYFYHPCLKISIFQADPFPWFTVHFYHNPLEFSEIVHFFSLTSL